ncbi:Type II secretion system protein D precursor [compost metagenome]
MKTLLLIFISIFASQALAQNITLHLGGTQNLPLKGQSNVWIQDRQLVTAEVIGGEVRVRGLREGSTVIKIGSQSYQLQVVHPEKAEAFAELNEKMKSFVGLRVHLDRSRLVVRGRLYRWADWEKLADLLQDSQIAYVMNAELSPELQAEAQRNLSNLLEKAKLPPQTIIFDPEPEIRVAGSDLVFRRSEQLFRPYGIQITKDDSSLDVAPTIKVEITVAEIKRSKGLQYGLKWPSSYTATILPDGSVNKSELPFMLSALEQQGIGKVLASPNIICRSGKEAEFLAGGEFPIKVVNYKAQDVVWKRYGILLRVRPKADAAGRLSISVETEVSTLDKSTSVEGIPGVLTNRVSSHFDLTKPQTIALSGLLKNENGNSSDGLPLLSRLPVLGALFSSKDYLENRSELVIFVRPSIMKEEDEPHNPSHLSELKELI